MVDRRGESEDSSSYSDSDCSDDSSTKDESSECQLEKVHWLIDYYDGDIEAVLDALSIQNESRRSSLKAEYQEWCNQIEEHSDGKRNICTMEEILAVLKKDVEEEGQELKHATKRLEDLMGRGLVPFELSFIEHQYIKIVLDVWLSKSFEDMKDFIEEAENLNINQIWNDDFIMEKSQRSFYAQLMTKQAHLFPKEMKEKCFQKLRTQCHEIFLEKMKASKKNCDANKQFFAALIEFFQAVNIDLYRAWLLQTIPDDFTSGAITAQQFAEKICLLKSPNLPESLTGRLRTTFNSLAVNSETEATMKVLCSSFLFPATTIVTEEVDGRFIIKVKGISIVISEILDELENTIKQAGKKIEDVHFHGLSVVHINKDLSTHIWHGMNVVVATNRLVVHGKVTWDVSGLDNTNCYTLSAPDGSGPSGNGKPGQHGLPGESGGNIYIVCNEAYYNSSDFSLISRGGTGSNGQHGGQGQDGQDGEDAEKITREKFEEQFPSMSYLLGVKKSWELRTRTVKDSLNKLLVSRSTDWSSGNSFFIDGKTKEGGRIIVSYYEKITYVFNWQHSIYLYQGNNGSQGQPGGKGGAGGEGGAGGYHGNVKFTRQDGAKYSFNSGGHTIGDRGQSGSKGNDGRGGKRGNHGKAAGDVAFKGWLNDDGGKYYGFGSGNQNYEIRYNSTEIGEPVWCEYHGKWADIFNRSVPQREVVEDTQREKKKYFEEKRDALKKKSVLQSTLSQYMKDIVNQTQMLTNSCLSIDQKLTTTVASLSQQIDEKTTRNYSDTLKKDTEYKDTLRLHRCHNSDKVFLLHKNRRLTSKTIQHEEDSTIELCRRCRDQHEDIDLKNLPFVAVGPEQMGKCLEVKETKFDADNIFHCINGFEDPFGLRICKDAENDRKILKKYVEKVSQDIVNYPKLFLVLKSAIKNFILRPRNQQYPEAIKLENMYMEFKKNEITLAKTFHEQIELSRDLEIKLLYNQRDVSWSLKKWIKANKFLLLDSNESNLTQIIQQIVQTVDWNEAVCSKKLLNEYCKFINDATETLSLGELELLAYATDMAIHLYVEDNDSLDISYIDSFNEDGTTIHHIMCKDSGVQYLEKNLNKFEFLENRAKLAAFYKQNNQTESYNLDDEEVLLTLLEAFQEPKYYQVVDWIKRLDPEITNQPDILRSLHINCQDKTTTIDPNDLSYVLEAIVNWILEGRDCIFIVEVLSNYCQHNWKNKVLLWELEDQLGTVITHEKKWIKCLNTISRKIIDILRKSLSKTISITTERLYEVLSMLSHGLDLSFRDLDRLSELSLNDWIFELRSKSWEKQAEGILYSEAQKKELVYAFLELENKRGIALSESTFKKIKSQKELPWKEILKIVDEAQSAGELESKNERCLNEISLLIQKDSNTSEKLKNTIQNIATSISAIKPGEYGLDAIKDWVKKIKLTFPVDAPVFISVFDRAVELIYGFNLRDTQKIAITTYLDQEKNIFAQVSTGEGKSLIVAGLAIAKVLAGHRVDVITSNSLLAIRDSTSNESKKGIMEIYQAFEVAVGHNCSEKEEDRTKSYFNKVVYGELSHFQRDYLLHTFYGRNIRGDRSFDCIIVDEVDCMLLDRGINTLYLSHDIPGMDSLESIYVYIWQKVCTSPWTLEEIRSSVFYDIYGEIVKDDLKSINNQLTSLQLNAIWASMIQLKIIDCKGRLLLESLDQIQPTIEKLPISDHGIKPKLAYYMKNVLERPNQIRVPKNLLPFVDRHIDTWLGNAFKAISLESGENYVVDVDRSRSSPDLSPQITIIDPDTGTDQSSSQWDGALHQFLQLKEGCQITLQSLKAVFVSNITYIQLYRNLSGLSGTLGSGPERSFLQRIYKSEYLTVPTAMAKQFRMRPSHVMSKKTDWLQAIFNDLHEVLVEEKRSVLVFCQSINEVNEVSNIIKEKFPELESSSRLHKYVRDYETFEFERDELGIGHVIVATNLAGRGTDIQIDKELSENGGLHICLTYLPENIRIEEQAFGRSGRKGMKGSGKLILFETSSHKIEWKSSKVFDLKEERNRAELIRISKLENDFNSNIVVLEKCFDLFKARFQQLKIDCDQRGLDIEVKEILCQCALDAWAFWLDSIEADQSLKKQTPNFIINRLKCELIDKLSILERKSKPQDFLQLPLRIAMPVVSFALSPFLSSHGVNFDQIFTWLQTPARLVPLGKHFAAKKQYSDAELLFDYLIKKGEFFYPAARYYKAFIILNRSNLDTNKDKRMFIEELRAAERVLTENINIQSGYSYIVSSSTQKSGISVCPIEGYEKQKENTVVLLEQFLKNIRYLLGEYLSISGLVDAGIDESEAEYRFYELLDLELVTYCNLESNFDERTMKKVFYEYGINQDEGKLLMKKFEEEKNISEKNMEQLVKSHDLFQTKKMFWNFLIEKQVLDNVMDCIIVLKTDDSTLDPKNQIHLPSNDPNLLLFNPFFDEEYISKNERWMFPKSYIKDHYGQSYKKKLKDFESNKFGIINQSLLRKVNMSAFGIMNQTRFAEEEIETCERGNIWDALIKQSILNANGTLGEAAITSFAYPDCPAYEVGVQYLLQRIFAFERVKRALVQGEMKAINELSHKPERSLLCDLFAAQIIRSHQVLKLPDKSITSEVTDVLHITEQCPCIQLILEEFYNDGKISPFQEKMVNSMANFILQSSIPIINKDEAERREKNKEKAKRIARYLINSQSAFVNLETPVGNLKQLDSETFEELNNIGTELYVFALNGLEHIIEIEDKKWSIKMIIRSVIVIAFGVAQIIFSAYIELQSFGLATHLAAGFLSEGISDILYGFSALTTGKNFTWADYRVHKLESIKMTAITVAVGAFFSKGVPSKSFGSKVRPPGLIKDAASESMSKSQMIWKVVKANGGQIGKRIALGALSHGVEQLVNSKLRDFCEQLGKEVVVDVKKAVDDVKLNESLDNLCRVKGNKEAGRVLDSKTQYVLNERGQIMSVISKYVSAFGAGLSDAMARQAAHDNSWENTAYWVGIALKSISLVTTTIRMAEQIYTITSSSLKEIKAELDTTLKDQKGNEAITDQKVEEFQRMAIERLKQSLQMKAEQLIRELTTMILQQFTQYAAKKLGKLVKTIYRSYKERKILKQFKKEKKKESRRRKRARKAGKYKKKTWPSKKFVKAGLELMKKTRSPKLFADLVRSGVPTDRFCANGLAAALPELLKKQRPDLAGKKFRIQIETSDGEMVHQTGDGQEAAPDEIVIKISLDKADGKKSGHYLSNKSGSNDHNCMFSAIAEQLKDKVGINLNEKEMRSMAADMIEKDPSVRSAIEKGWHVVTIERGFFGGTAKNKNKGKQEQPKSRPFGEEVHGWNKDYTLHLDPADKRLADKSIITRQVERDVKDLLDMMDIDKEIGFDQNAAIKTLYNTSKDGKAAKDGVRIDMQKIDGKNGERQYANLQIQINGIKGQKTTVAEIHLELGKSFKTSQIRDAIKRGMDNRNAVWLSAKDDPKTSSASSSKGRKH